jgi:hypothetical protein
MNSRETPACRATSDLLIVAGVFGESGDRGADSGFLISLRARLWQARGSLAAVYTTALARMCSPWAVLARAAARALTQVRPHVTLPPLIGGPGSLNWFAAISPYPVAAKDRSRPRRAYWCPGLFCNATSARVRA